MFTTERTEQAKVAVKRALQITYTDTLGSIGAESRVIWTASGSWTGSQPVTIGDIYALVMALTKAEDRLAELETDLQLAQLS